MASVSYEEPLASDALEPIAIVGMGCRWPGDSETPSELWDYLTSQSNSYSKFPEDRINGKAFYHPDGNRPGSFKTEGGCFLRSDVRQFDAGFFGINPKELLTLDPAQRKFMEVVYETFESAGQPLQKLSGSRTGTFVGNFNYDHQLMHYRDPENALPYSVTGSGITIISNRINHVFNLKGPSLTLDTACSSSLYALHLACSALQTGDCDAAIVGGTNLILTPECQIFSSVLGAVSPTSVCHTFDSRADGYARADGVGAIFIKRLTDAVADGDPIRAVIRGTAFNANGRTGGITHPDPDGQEACIRRAYARAGGLDPALTGYFECHGTGTPVGDPIEVSAVGRVFADSRTATNPLYIGSIKSNMGHSEPASGMAGLMKAVLAIERGIIPSTIGIENLNPNVDLRDGRLKIVTENTSWPDLPFRRASINSFGYGGSNAHAIVESVEALLPGYRRRQQACTFSAVDGTASYWGGNGIGMELPPNGQTNGHMQEVHQENGVRDPSEYRNSNSHRGSVAMIRRAKRYLLPFSAHDERTLAANYEVLMTSIREWNLQDVAFTLSERRSRFQHRTFAIMDIEDHASEISKDLPVFSKIARAGVRSLGFVFTGQGAQWPRMGASLMEEYPSCLSTIRRLDQHLDRFRKGKYCHWRIEHALNQSPETSHVHRAEFSQPLVTAVQIMIVNLFASWDIKPRAVVGHSSGEIAAAYAAGRMNEEEAILVAYLRGKAVAKNETIGLMMAVGCTLSHIRPLVDEHGGAVTIACHNSPESYTLSGDAEAVSAIKDVLDGEKIFCRILQTNENAYHSDHMRLLGADYERELDAFMPKKLGAAQSLKQKSKDIAAQAVFFSSVHGYATPWSMLTSRYWRQNLESPVLFHQAVTELVTRCPVDLLIEIGPHGALKGPLRQLANTFDTSIKFPSYISAISRGSDNVAEVLTLAGTLFARGYDVDLAKVNAVELRDGTHLEFGKVVTDLPRYQWRYPDEISLFENRYTREWRLRTHPRHDILGSRIPGTNQAEPLWRNMLSVKNVPWLRDHRLGPDIVFPATGYIALAVEAATQIAEIRGLDLSQIEYYDVRNVSLLRALIIPENDFGIETLFTMRPAWLNTVSRHKWLFDFVVTSVSNVAGKDTFVEHCRGQVEVGRDGYVWPENRTVSDFQASMGNKKVLGSEQWYESFARAGLRYGPTFQGHSRILTTSQANICQARVGLQPTSKLMSGESRYFLHPATLDACLQLSIIAAHGNDADNLKRAFMPTEFRSVKLWPSNLSAGQAFADAYSSASLKGIRGARAELSILGADSRRLLEATQIFLAASDQSAVKSTEENSSPYTRIVWKPDFDSLTTDILVAMYPPVALDDGAVIPSLNNLALHQLIHFKATHPDIFREGSREPHLQRLLDWVTGKLAMAAVDRSSTASRIMEFNDALRSQRIEELSIGLKSRSSEARLMCSLYDSLPDIYSGKKTGIQVSLQDNLLVDNYETGQVYREGNRRLAAVVALLSHQKPDIRILEVGGGTGSATNEVLPALNGRSIWRQYSEYRFTDTTPSFLSGAEEKFAGFGGMTYGVFDMERDGETQGYRRDWDVVLASNVIHATSDIRSTLVNIRNILKPGGKLILLELTRSQLSAGLVLGTFSDFWKADLDPSYPRHDGPFLSKSLWRTVLHVSGFSGLDFYLDDYAGDNVSATVLCATATDERRVIPPAITQRGIVIAYRTSQPPFAQPLADHLTIASGVPVSIVSLASIDVTMHRRLIFVIEVGAPFFLDATPQEWEMFRSVVMCADSMLWITAGDLLRGGEPLHAMVCGLAKGLKTENKSVRFGVLDLDRVPQGHDADLYDVIGQVERRIVGRTVDDITEDSEFRCKDGILHIGRLTADERALPKHASATAHSDRTPLPTYQQERVGDRPLKLAIEKPGVLSTIFFEDDPDFAAPLAADEVEIEVRFAGINNKDIAVLTGRHHSDSFGDECSGVVTKVGDAVGEEELRVGDEVYCQSFSKFGNVVRDKAMFCRRLQGDDTLEAVATMPVAFCTAIHGLMDLGRLGEGETVLIQSATGAVGLAACQIARMIRAEIFATVGSDEKVEALLAMGFGIARDHVFDSRDAVTPRRIMERTGGRGIDVILSSARGELMHEYWGILAASGRFIEIGRTEVLDGGSLSMDVFRRNATFASFDLEVISETKPHLIARLMATIQDLKAKGHITPLPLQKFDVADIDQAFLKFTKGTHVGKLVVEFDRTSTRTLKVRRDPFISRFDPDACYLLVGCLGGLGRSFSTWAISRGARHLIYLSRSGAAQVDASTFIDGLRVRGIDVTVVTGDASCLEDVQTAVDSARHPIKGVIQAALTLQDSLFESMTLEQFNTTAHPRVIGTQNLHRATIGCPLDFFQMWSSWTAIFGTATQSNYLASNTFLDAFARHRRARGLPCTSLSLSQVLGVGVVSHNPEYQQAMARNGFYGNNEGEFLRYCDRGLLRDGSEPDTDGHRAPEHDPLARAHLLAGIEPAGLRSTDRRHPLRDMAWHGDPSLRNLIQATSLLRSPPSSPGAPEERDAALLRETDRPTLDRVVGRISRLLYIPADEVDPDRNIADLGVDSMVGAELRNWIATAFGRDVSMLRLLSVAMTLRRLAEELEKGPEDRASATG